MIATHEINLREKVKILWNRVA